MGRSLLPRARVLAGWTLALAGLPLLTLGLTALRRPASLPSVLLLFLMLVLGVSAVGGTWPALATGVAGALLVNYYFTPPLHTFSIAEPQHALALIVFVAVGVVVSALVSAAARRAAEAARAVSEAEMLARGAGALVAADDPVPELLSQLRSAFDLSGVALRRRQPYGWTTEAVSGEVVDADTRVDLSDDLRLVLSGRPLGADDLRVIDAFAAQLETAFEHRRLRREAAAAQELQAASDLRAALLAGVSHDLRTPLASIKASVTSLLQRDVAWTPDAVREFLDTIDGETDRLNVLVGNLLDMSRLQMGGLSLSMQEVGLEEVVASVLAGLGERAHGVVIDVPETLPAVLIDPALLDRAVANLVVNALTHGSADVRVVARADAGRVLLRVIDHGPGIPPEQREHAFRAFQRLGDRRPGGVGLGLAVARGFVEAMGGVLTMEGSPGGGLTVVVDLKAAPS